MTVQSKKKESKQAIIIINNRYDLLHNAELLKMNPKNILKIFSISKSLADVVVPQE